MVDDRAKALVSRHIDLSLCGDVRIVRKQTRVLEQLVSIDRRLGDVLQAHHEKLQCLPRIDREQLP